MLIAFANDQKMQKFYAAFLGLILLSCVMSTPVLVDSDKCPSTSDIEGKVVFYETVN